VVVTPAQVDAAKTVIEWSEKAGRAVPDSVRRVAQASRASANGSSVDSDADTLTSLAE
jgi:hypothetical protein